LIVIFKFEDFSLDVDRQELWQGRDLVDVEPQVFDLLQYLIRNRERVVTKDDLIAHVWNGRMVSDSTLSSRITSARRAIGDNGDSQRLIRTVARKGIRFVGEIEENQVANETKIVGPGTTLAPESQDSSSTGTTIPRLPDKPSIAVLPFSNMSGDPEQEYFADGVTEDIVTALSKLRWLFIIARNSSFAYRGKTVDVNRIARELGVRYILEGSVRKGGSRLRITAQLIDAETGIHIWADHYDGEVTDVFDLQDEITRRVVGAIEPRVLEAEGVRSRKRSPDNLDAWDLVIHANSLLWRLTKMDGEAAIHLLKKAVDRYPDYGPAYSMFAFALLMSGYLARDLGGAADRESISPGHKSGGT